MAVTCHASTPAEIAQYADATGYQVDYNVFRGISARDDAGRLLGVIGCDYWTPTACQMHVWYKSPMALRGGLFLREAFTYVFKTHGRKVVFGIIPSNNEKALKHIAHVGFTEICRLKDGWDNGVDMVINEMSADKCRWLEQ